MKKNKAKTQHTTVAQTNKHNVNKTRVNPQITGGKDEPDIVFMWNTTRNLDT